MRKYCIVNSTNSIFTEKIEGYGYTCIGTEKSTNVSVPIALHADVLYNIVDGNFVVSDCQQSNISFLENMGFKVLSEHLEEGYRTECKLNFVLENGTLVYNPSTVTDLLVDYKADTNIVVKQGYTKCSTVVLSKDDFITEDSGIYNALISAGKNCLLIEKSYVKLEGYDYGFIGGASVFLKNENTLMFFGDITVHQHYEQIKSFCEKCNVKVDYISKIPLEDIGGAVIFNAEK